MTLSPGRETLGSYSFWCRENGGCGRFVYTRTEVEVAVV